MLLVLIISWYFRCLIFIWSLLFPKQKDYCLFVCVRKKVYPARGDQVALFWTVFRRWITWNCNECLNKSPSLSIIFTVPPIVSSQHCYCHEAEYGRMIECGKCRSWFHSACLELSDPEISLLRLFFCTGCLNEHQSLRIVFKDPSEFVQQHTKPLFKKNNILQSTTCIPTTCFSRSTRFLSSASPTASMKSTGISRPPGKTTVYASVSPKPPLTFRDQPLFINPLFAGIHSIRDCSHHSTLPSIRIVKWKETIVL